MEKDTNIEKEEQVEEIKLSKDYWVLELDNISIDNVISIDNLDNTDSFTFDVVKLDGDRTIFMRFPKGMFRGIYKVI